MSRNGSFLRRIASVASLNPVGKWDQRGARAPADPELRNDVTFCAAGDVTPGVLPDVTSVPPWPSARFARARPL